MKDTFPTDFHIRSPKLSDLDTVHKLIVDSQNLTGATRLYERAGMHVARTYISYEKELCAGIKLSTQAIPI